MRLPYVVKTWFQTRKSPILPQPVPFIVLDAIKFLDKIVQPGMSVIEAGGVIPHFGSLKKARK